MVARIRFASLLNQYLYKEVTRITVARTTRAIASYTFSFILKTNFADMARLNINITKIGCTDIARTDNDVTNIA
jgi:hypothetical protein